ncbi:MAG: hypothetical protein ACTHOG_08690 [Marmoricola sp.]
MMVKKAVAITGGLGLAMGVCGVVTAGSAGAAQQIQQVTCEGQTYTIRTNTNNSSDKGGQSSVQIVAGGSGHFTPTSFAGTLVDESTHQTLFSFQQTKGNGNANHNQASITCTDTQQSTLGEFWDPSQPLPAGTSADDPVTFTITVTVVHHP